MGTRRHLQAGKYLLIAASLLVGLSGASIGDAGAAPAAPPRVVIADQFGPGHLVTVVIKRRRLLERQFPDTKFEWKIVTSGAVMRDGMIADDIQIGITAPPPFLVGVDKGVKWKIIAGAATYDQWLVTKDPDIKSIRDFKGAEKRQIALVGLDSFPAIVVRKAAQREFGDPRALDSDMVIMRPPDAVQAVLGGQLAGALIPPVFCVRAVDGGAHIALRSVDVFSGPVTNNFYVMTDDFYRRHPDVARAFYDAVQEAVKFIKSAPGEAFAMLSEDEGGKTPPDKYRDLIERSGTEYGVVPYRVLEVAEFMKQIGMIGRVPQSMREIEFPPLGGAGS